MAVEAVAAQPIAKGNASSRGLWVNIVTGPEDVHAATLGVTQQRRRRPTEVLGRGAADGVRTHADKVDACVRGHPEKRQRCAGLAREGRLFGRNGQRARGSFVDHRGDAAQRVAFTNGNNDSSAFRNLKGFEFKTLVRDR